jgi:hypothetical protein
VGPRTGLDDLEKGIFLTLPGLELRPLGRPSRSRSLYRLSYPGSFRRVHGVIEAASSSETSMTTYETSLCQLNSHALHGHLI